MSIFKRGNKYWIGFRFNHLRYRRVSPDNSYSGAKAYEALLRQKLSRGEKLETEVKKDNKVLTFKEFSEQWLEVYVKTNNKPSEISNKESFLRAHLVPFFGDKPIDKINSLDVESFKAHEIKNGLSSKSINNFLIVLSRCLRIAQEWEVIKTVPKIKLLKIQVQKFDFLSEIECQALLSNCDGVLRDMILVALKTGLRFGELIALEWQDIDFTNNLMTVRQSLCRGEMGETKSSKIRYIPLSDNVCQVLLSMTRQNSFVFTKSNGEMLGAMICLRWLGKACEAAGLRKIGWHALRHTFASQLAQNGASIMVIKELLGHSDIRMTMRYSHLTKSVTREAILLLDKNNGHNMATVSNLGVGEFRLSTPAVLGIL